MGGEEEPSKKKVVEGMSMLAIITCIYNFFSFLANFVLLETIMVKLAIDQWGWEDGEAIQKMGYVIMGAGGMSIFIFAIIGPLSKRFDERLLLVVLGIIPMILGRVIMFPIPGQPLPPQPPPATTTTTTIQPTDYFYTPLYLADPVRGPRSAANGGIGCYYDWCLSIPRIHIVQFILGFFVATAGYPFCLTLTGSIYSKLLGTANTGFWLGLFATSGSLARVLGPLVVTEIYELWGTYVLFIVVTITLVISLILSLISWRKLVPLTDSQEDGKKGEGSGFGVRRTKKEEKGRDETGAVAGRPLPVYDEAEEE